MSVIRSVFAFIGASDADICSLDKSSSEPAGKEVDIEVVEPAGTMSSPTNDLLEDLRKKLESVPLTSGQVDTYVPKVVSKPTLSPKVIYPVCFADARILADRFRTDDPVLMSLQGLNPELARRLLDFASGFCYGLGGRMQKLAPRTFLLIPQKAQVSTAAVERIRSELPERTK